MVFFMVFIANSKADNIDTIRGRLMLAWYQSHRALPVWARPQPAFGQIRLVTVNICECLAIAIQEYQSIIL